MNEPILVCQSLPPSNLPGGQVHQPCLLDIEAVNVLHHVRQASDLDVHDAPRKGDPETEEENDRLCDEKDEWSSKTYLHSRQELDFDDFVLSNISSSVLESTLLTEHRRTTTEDQTAPRLRHAQNEHGKERRKGDCR